MKSKKSKTKELYESFSNQTLTEISDFLTNPMVNQSELIINLHNFLSEHLKTNDEVNKTKAFYAIHSKSTPYSDVKIRVYLTKLNKLIQKYIAYKQMDRFSHYETFALLDYYYENNLSKNLQTIFNNEPKLEFNSFEDKLRFDFEFSAQKLKYLYQQTSAQAELISEQMNLTIQLQKKLREFQTLNMLCDYYSVKQLYRNDYDVSKDEATLTELIQNRDEQDEMSQNYISILSLYKNFDENEFNILRENYKKLHPKHFQSNRQFIQTQLQNFCVRLINSGKSEYLNTLFEIYQDTIAYYIEEGDLSSTNFRNIVYVALNLNQIDWAENFVETYHKLVIKDEQQNAYNFNYARIFFERKDYKSAMKQLLKVEYEDVLYAVSARLLLAKCYFELDDTMPLISSCNSLEQYIKRSKEISKARIENLMNFTKYLKILQKNRIVKGKTYFKELSKKVQDKNIIEKEWLSNKIDELAGLKLN